MFLSCTMGFSSLSVEICGKRGKRWLGQRAVSDLHGPQDAPERRRCYQCMHCVMTCARHHNREEGIWYTISSAPTRFCFDWVPLERETISGQSQRATRSTLASYLGVVPRGISQTMLKILGSPARRRGISCHGEIVFPVWSVIYQGSLTSRPPIEGLTRRVSAKYPRHGALRMTLRETDSFAADGNARFAAHASALKEAGFIFYIH